LVQSVIDIAQHLPNSKAKQIIFETNTERIPTGRITAPVTVGTPLVSTMASVVGSRW